MRTRQRVLVIDDNEGIRELLDAVLGRAYEVSVAADGKTGLARALKELPDLVLCDVTMPLMSGLEVLEELWSNPATKEIPVVLMSGRGEVMSVPPTAGRIEYLQKPFHFGEVLALVAEVLLRDE